MPLSKVSLIKEIEIQNYPNNTFVFFQCRDFVKSGAFKGNNPAEVVQSCDITFSCVADSTAVKDVRTLIMNSSNKSVITNERKMTSEMQI